MVINIERRTFVKIISFILATIIMLGAAAYIYWAQAKQSTQTLKYQYQKGIENLTLYSQNINSDLTKALYCSTPDMLLEISAKLWRETGFAKDALDSLPIDALNLANTNKLLSQLGNYCLSLSKAYDKGTTLSKEQRENLIKLKEYCELMLEEIVVIADGIKTGAISMTALKGNINREFDKTAEAAQITDGFKDFEAGFETYPTLIYDGPFSDHIMEKEAEHIKGKLDFSRANAKKKAALISSISVENLNDESDENSKMASYCFGNDSVDISITKKGGIPSYMLKSRLIKEQKLETKQALTLANEYVNLLDMGEFAVTYFEISSNIMTVNYAAKQGDITLYPDLIKISVALDNGEIMGFDARGYIVNHKERKFSTPHYSLSQAQKRISLTLEVESGRLCLIPSSGLNEVLCYEFKCKSKTDDQELLVYINAETLREEQLLILLVSENGTLTI